MRLTPPLAATLLLVGTAGCGSSTASAASVTVEIVPSSVPGAGGAYKPATVHIAPGTTVTWVERDTRLHTVTARDNSYGSNFLKTGQTYPVRFNKPGTYPYLCAIHPGMTGEVVVE